MSKPFKVVPMALLGLLLAFPSFAAKPKALAATGPDFVVTVYPTVKCTNKKVAAILKKYKAPFGIKDMISAKILFEGKTVKGCAQLRSDIGAVMVVGEDGNGSVVPAESFSEVNDI